MSMIKKGIKLAIAASFTASALTTSVLSVAAQEDEGTNETKFIESEEENKEITTEAGDETGSESAGETAEGEDASEKGEEASDETPYTYGGIPVRKVLEFLNWVINDPNTAPVDAGDGSAEVKKAEIKDLLENGTDEDIDNWLAANMKEESAGEAYSQELTEEEQEEAEFYTIYLMSLGTKYVPNIMSEEEFIGDRGKEILDSINSKLSPEEKEMMDALIATLRNAGDADPTPADDTNPEEPVKQDEGQDDGSEKDKEETKEENTDSSKEDKKETEEKKEDTSKNGDSKSESGKNDSSSQKTSGKVATAAGFDMLQLVNMAGIMAGAVYVMRKKEEE